MDLSLSCEDVDVKSSFLKLVVNKRGLVDRIMRCTVKVLFETGPIPNSVS